MSAALVLAGVVDTRFERAHAADVVGNVKGVVDIDNYLASYEALQENPAASFER